MPPPYPELKPQFGKHLAVFRPELWDIAQPKVQQQPKTDSDVWTRPYALTAYLAAIAAADPYWYDSATKLWNTILQASRAVELYVDLVNDSFRAHCSDPAVDDCSQGDAPYLRAC